MNRSKKLQLLLGVLAIVCIATFVVIRMEERKEQIKNSEEIILELSGDSVQSLSWEYDGKTLAFHKEDTWLYDEDAGFPVSEEKISELLDIFQEFGVSFIIEDVEDFGQYGLDDPICTIRLATEEQTYEVKLGDHSKMDSQRYVSIGDGNVYLVKNDPLDLFDATIRNLIDHDEVPDFSQVTGITFSGTENYSITYEEDSTDTYRAEDVYFTKRNVKNVPLDTDRVKTYLDNMGYLNLTDYVSYNVTDEELETYGLDAPELTVSVNYTAENENGEETENTFVLHVSRDPEEKKAAAKLEEDSSDEEITAYARVGDSQIVYQITSSGYRWLMAASYDDLRHPEVLPASFEDIRQIDVDLEGGSYTFTSEKDGRERAWSYQDEGLEIDSLQNAMEALTADKFTNEKPTLKEEIGLTIHLDPEYGSEISIQFYRYDGSDCLAVVDGQTVSLVKRAKVVDLIEAVQSIILD